jgi:hypothetical protein
MKLKLQGYSSTQTALTEDQVYRLAGRIIALNIKSPPVLYFEQQLNGLISKSNSYNQSLANKVGCTGFGIVVDKSESEAMNNNGTYYKNLNMILCHTNYDNSVCPQFNPFLFAASWSFVDRNSLIMTIPFGAFSAGKLCLFWYATLSPATKTLLRPLGYSKRAVRW